ncbi:ROK family protein [Kineococcus rhizosphaerae]|uniref:Putative NBD/HSP70 family sugar kinase n=1 Tax=Kineococcus rhizosphaerae TaxID=559628 RepID=A0A2T0R3N7_9ACTN|nr:ROK family protein [Kineococcus rhizosphaerae]PRY14688.1 putative NBD/HSP70 family sugar kinase [Kineococcus rhizosphaerae]
MTSPTAPAARPHPTPWRTSTRGLRPSAKVLPTQARAHNRAVVLGLLFHSGPVSRADLARATGLTRVTVSEIVGELLADGLVAELGLRPEGRVGKPAMMVGLRSTEHHIVAVDLQRLPVARVAVLDLAGAVVSERTEDFSGVRGQEAVDAVERVCREAIGAAVQRVVGVGVGTPGIVDAAGGIVESVRLGWKDLPLAETLTTRLGVGVHVANDADAAALAEFTYAGASASGFMAVVVGQGVGAGIVLDGHLVRGHRLAAGEIGHLTVDPRGEPCECGRRGCLETIVAPTYLARTLEGRTPARRRVALRDAGRRLGAVLAPVVAALDLEEVLLVGPGDLLDGPLLDAATSTVEGTLLPTTGPSVRLRLGRLGENGVLQGAAALVLAGEFGFS